MSIEPQKVVIDELLRDSILVVVQLKAKADIPSGHKLYELCKQQVMAVREKLFNAQYSKDVIDDISYALCALLDETVLLCDRDNPKNQDYDEWLGAPLQVIFFNTHNAGNDLFDKVRARLKADKKDFLVLSCFDRVLGLGFQGRYLDKPQMEREHLILALREALREYEPEQSHPIIEQTQTHRYWGRKTVLLSCTGLSIVAVVALYFVLNYRLDTLIQQIVG
ncbi:MULTISPECIES: type VI secretion system protein TssL, short form [unclassified Gilliamella]|uniref:type VI secretion system protein TssL, short form n=1 Tax=unclassified Gilliamella TaxID=2685620 RepID=UPI00080E6BA4|nr:MULTISPECIES: type VI secretion system protein TssL, short form [Gilliamella]MCX8641268.1 type VI secretion system protein TssL, short form [Gilliamella sp. B3835]MCX8706973.1 type VI secretion system protein TssL, short form [Gilliamella sp. B3783]MCX8709804.1 type VI secretion system protein TssL, short form [Gilliamella sp. B3780]MCX8714149.1 type VI secretion system protein TssL, short form [Gilliamella sp. B3781]MCX8715956.1 type VI secretion system protein TssL, short form [Gilliamell